MGLKRRTVIVTGGMSLCLAGCTGDNETTPVEDGETTAPDETDDQDTETDSDDQDANASDSTTAESADATVQVRSHSEHGDILVGPDEMTLYMFDQDTRGEAMSSCYDSCATNWPPLTVADTPVAGDGVAADLEAFERETGERQVMAGGWPLYYFAPDEEPGDATGQGANDVWWVLNPDGTPVKPAGGY
ncbi:hypothetical protein [Halorubrum salsamenti]|uniref:hypothetical protein n=1 Tax=Halorubrum salsamenti TaxID=2583990 RepID=UPI0011AA3347|nr:hypothetical protein [Halorubrum salsamenti]